MGEKNPGKNFDFKSQNSLTGDIYKERIIMKLKMTVTVAQFKKLMELPDDTKENLPIITMDLAKIGKKQAQEITNLLKKKRS